VVTINFANGSVDGEVISGNYEGKQLSELSADELKELSQQYKQTDRESFILLQAYMIRSGSSSSQSDNQFKSNSFSDISNDEAYNILGLPTSASQEDIIKAHKRLMQRIHPDRGGSDYLAAKINAAKDQLTK
jgi:alkyl sulfatase BDS1-like metallo-beta-lactamase superfamily hydrolase